MASTRKEVIRDHRDKVILENSLLIKLRRYDNNLVSQYRSASMRGEIFQLAPFQTPLEELLLAHYYSTMNKFSGRIENQIAKDLRLTPAEKAQVTLYLQSYAKSRAPQQASYILKTTQNEINVINASLADELDTQTDRAVAGATVLKRRLWGRESGIAISETQAMAEASKRGEFDGLAGRTPLSSEQLSEPLQKEWVTLGDEVTRSAHLLADTQIKNLDEPFIVNGDRLRWPGDGALGAHISNIINCRCSAVYDTGAVSALRVRRGEEGSQFDNTVSPGLAASLDI